MNAICGWSCPIQSDQKSSSVIVKVASGLTFGTPFLTSPCPFLRSISKVATGLAPLTLTISNPKVP
jgi:hypothetical protein